ncbi:MAG: restriction system protein [Methylophagaceae bacterium]|jgi:restriction system protein
MPVILNMAAESDQIAIRHCMDNVADHFNLSEEEREQTLPSGKQKVLYNRTYWASFDLLKAGLLEKRQRGIYAITERGRDVYSTDIDKLSRQYLSRYPEYAEYLSPNKKDDASEPEIISIESSTLTPQERIEKAYRELHQILKAELMERILSCSPEFFEKLIIDLMIGMGYGGSLKEAAEHVGKSNDGGIDGVINEDRLGLDRIYLQAKRYASQNTVGRPELQGFAGSLLGRGANKGVFVTTSSFTKGAMDYVENLPQRIVLVDGDELTTLMIKYGVGVRMEQRFELMKADEDYYIED